MIITIGTDIICDGANRDTGKSTGPESLNLSGSFDVQIAKYLRAAVSNPIPRLNGSAQVSFSINRKHSTVDAAHTFSLTHIAALTKSGTLTLVQGTSYVRLLLAVLSTWNTTQNGLNVHVTYTFIGSTLETYTP